MILSSMRLTNSAETVRNTSGKRRHSAIELLRILAMCGVVILHYNNKSVGGGFRYATGLNCTALVVLESPFICAVNLYVLISGYFLSATQKRSLNKPFELVAQVCAFGAGRYLLRCLMSGGWSVKALLLSIIPNNYFVVLYVTLYLISPYLNLMLQQLSKKQFRILTALLLFLFSLWPTLVDVFINITEKSLTGLSTINAFASQRGYTIVQFALMYILGAFIHREQENLKKIPAAVLLAGYVALMCACAGASTSNAWAYHNPLVILSACAAMLIALRWQFESKLVNRLALSAFTCFLFHDLLLGYLGIQKAVTGSLPGLLIHVILSAVAVYLICYVVYFVWDLVTKPLFRFCAKYLSKADRFFTVTVEEK